MAKPLLNCDMANHWGTKSFELMLTTPYLDDLRTNIYSVSDNPLRPLSREEKKTFTKLYKGKDDEKLFRFLLEQERRPINDSYFASFSSAGSNTRGKSKGKLDKLIRNNPATIGEICTRVRKLTAADCIKKMAAPKDPSRQMGQKFSQWLKKKYHCEKDENDFLKSRKKIVVFDAPSDDAINNLVKKHLCTKIPRGEDEKEKGIDFLLKYRKGSKDIFFCGESKFLTDNGGTQNNQYNDAITFITSKNWKVKSSKKVVRCAVIDGVCWMSWKNNKMKKGIDKLTSEQYAFSALLLDDFIKSH